jgi:hypothetical protein
VAAAFQGSVEGARAMMQRGELNAAREEIDEAKVPAPLP